MQETTRKPESEKESPEYQAVITQEELNRLNESALTILNLPNMAALILKKSGIPGFDLPLETLAKRIRKTIIKDPGHPKDRLNLTDTENVNPKTGLVRFDSIFLLVFESAVNGTILVNIEVQNALPSPEWLAGRMEYYRGREIDSQKNDQSGFHGTEYQDLKPVCGLWILPHQTSTFVLDKPDPCFIVTGEDSSTARDLQRVLDGFSRIRVIGVGPDWRDNPNGAVQCMGHIFRSESSQEKQYDYLKKEGIPMTEAVESALKHYNFEQFTYYDEASRQRYESLMEQLRESEARCKESEARCQESEARRQEAEARAEEYKAALEEKDEEIRKLKQQPDKGGKE